jgi:transcriptional regulator with XRE-family HTH domain
MTTAPEHTATLTSLIARNIRSRMGWLDLSQRDLARRLGENDQWVSTRIKGKVALNTNDLLRFAKALEIGLHDLLPAPEEIEAVPVPRTTHGYSTVTERAPAHIDRPRDNRPSSRPVSAPPTTMGRTAYTVRASRRRRDR